MDADKETAPKETQIDHDEIVASRRQAMMKMAAYTAPVLLMVLTSEKAMAVSTVDCLPAWSPPKRTHRRRDD
jgi:hypothetical protein